ncbi:LOW QUALITY PROTEIN: hypothetical protein Cgig2_004363 [Carnegiea gigantea]|uniref:Uncharacterized protein n=1 Tax=Carnegiea gigantea TaxID=171969 RepID=A0A9Q1JKW2_9CARY|nr:LOW QUALITY PROTEIN: hypothetical protein Cgig2_004363 [Carnegiea gigantea]
MAFPSSLDTKAMSEFVICRFRGTDREGLPPAAAHYELPELLYAIFCAMLLNEAEKLGVLHGPRLRSLEMALTELCWGAFESWIWLFGNPVYEAQFHQKSGSGEGTRAGRRGESSSEGVAADDAAPKGHFSVHSQEELSVIVCAVSMAFPPTRSMGEMANYPRETFIWCQRSASCPPRPLPEDFNMLCPCFLLAEDEAAAAELELPEIATFYAMLLNEMLELGVVHEYTTERMKSLLVGLRWSTFEVWMRIMDEVIRGAQFHRQPDEVDVKGAWDGQGEGSGSADPPTPSSDEE